VKIRVFLAASVAALTALAGTSAATAQNQTGLVNVAIVDNTVQIPIGVAANVCDVSANILSAGTVTSPADCDAVANAFAFSTGTGGGGGGGANQTGLINLYVANNTIQVPVAVAANLCDIAINVLAAGTATGPASCDATGNAGATG
jgi:hypothetical protein